MVLRGIPKYINGQKVFGENYEEKVIKIYIWILK